jgi:predicted peptidase
MNRCSGLYHSILASVLVTAMLSMANTDNRHWTLASGEAFQAELVRYDPVTDTAYLNLSEGQQITYALADFAAIDSAWLLEWTKVTLDLEDLIADMDGTFAHYQHKGTDFVSDFYVYTPSQYKENQQLPMLILFHPSGKGARYVMRTMQAAEKVGVIVVSSDSFRNEKDTTISDAIFREILPVIEKTIPHDRTRLFMGGTSGGAMRAFRYSYEMDRPWAGILSNGGWLGGTRFYDKPYPRLRVAMLNGSSDLGANHWSEPDMKVLEARGCSVNVFAFEGAHQIAPTASQIEALRWLLHGDAQE